MNWLAALTEHWLDLLQTISLLVGLFATAHSIREGTRSLKVQNSLALTGAHRELWKMVYDHPKLTRVLEPKVDLTQEPPTLEEEIFVQMLILHLRSAIQARKMGLEFGEENIRTDIRQFFTLPIPRAIWDKAKQIQGPTMQDYVDTILS
jgi:hypothetical protein